MQDEEKVFLARPGCLEVVNRPGYAPYRPSELTLDERVERALSVGIECIQPQELRSLFEKKPIPIAYDGFEPSGRMHIAQGILKAINVNKLTSSGCIFVFWIADWFAMLNGKMGGDLKKIRNVGKYFIHVWKALGMDLTNVRFLWTSEEIERDSSNYWIRVMDIAKCNSISRVKRCGQIMGRGEGDEQPASQIMYPCMQAADVFYIGADICQLGLDQRKVNMLAREYVDDFNAANKKSPRLRKPVILSHAMMPGLLEGQEKMSKSNPESAIYMEDTEADVNRKIKKAFCPPGVVEGNPIVSYVKYFVFGTRSTFKICRSEKNGNDVEFSSYTAFETAYLAQELHPADVKAALVQALNEILEPVRNHFKEDPEARELLQTIKNYKASQ